MDDIDTLAFYRVRNGSRPFKLFVFVILLVIFVVNFCIMVGVRTSGDGLYRSLDHPIYCRHVLLPFLANQVEVVRKESVPSHRSPIGCTGHGPKDAEDEYIETQLIWYENTIDPPGTNEDRQIKPVLRVPFRR